MTKERPSSEAPLEMEDVGGVGEEGAEGSVIEDPLGLLRGMALGGLNRLGGH